MKSVASFILAAVVSAEYCYEDGCNCNGEARACYSVPRQNMKPNAINTCCPAGDQPTVYGRDNGRSVNMTTVTGSLKKDGNWNGNEFTGANVKTGGNTNCVKNCGTTINVNKLNHTMVGGSSATWSPTASLAWNADKCSAYCGTFGSYPPTKCERYGPCVVAPTVEAAPEVTTSLNWTNTRCRDYCQTTGAYPPMGCGQMTSPLSPYAEVCAPLAATASLKKDGNWNGNDFTGLNVQTGGNTNCVSGCGMEINVNNSLAAANTACRNTEFYIDEATTGNKCASDCQCDGARTCSPYGWCQGTSRPVTPAPVPELGCTSQARYIDEAQTGNRCTSDCQCDGARTCSRYNWCQGTSRPGQ